MAWIAMVSALLLGSAAMAGRQEWRAPALEAFYLDWRTVNDTFSDRTFGGLDWAAVRTELRPKVESASTQDAARQVLRDMLGRLHQSHFVLISASEGEAWPGTAMVPIDVRATDEGLVVTRVTPQSSSFRAGIRPGDRLTSIDGVDVEAWTVTADQPDPREKHFAVWRRAFRALHGPPGSTARLTLRAPSGTLRVVETPRTQPPGDVVTLGNLPPLQVQTSVDEIRTRGGRKVGVIAFSAWMTTVAGPFAAAVDTYRGAGGIVVDLRGNPGGLAEMIRGIAGHFLPTPELLGRIHMRDVDLEFRANPRRSTSDGRRVEPFAGPLAVLVDELTGSASECFAGGLQSLGRARVFGTQTMGQALPASTRQLPTGDVLMYAIGDFVTSTGRRLEGQGVMPDTVVLPSVAALAGGGDPPLAAALDWIDAQSKSH